RDNGEADWGWWIVLGISRSRHPRQPSTVGADHRDRLGRQLHQNSPQGIASAFDVGGEDGPADQLLQIGGGHYMITHRGKVRNLGKQIRIFHWQGELRMQTPY